MSKNKNNKKNVPAYARKKAKSNKNAIIIGAAVAAVALVILIVVFAVKSSSGNNVGATGGTTAPVTQATAKEAVTHNFETVEPPEGSKYEYVDYRGLKMPAEVAVILNQAEIDNAEACKKYGVAMSIGEYQVSRPRFEMYYNYACADKTSESLIMDSQGQMNTTGFDYNLAPDKQKYPGSQDKNYTWADKFTDDAISDMQYYFTAFESAVENKIELSDGHFQRMIYEYEQAIEGAENNAVSLEEYLNTRVGEHVTYEMYAAHCIMSYYAAEFQETEIQKHKDAVTDEELDKYYKENKAYLQVASIRLYPIEAEYEQADLDKVKDEASFLEFAQNTSIYSYYNAESATEYLWIDYNTIGGTFGEGVSKWIFEGGRKAGDIALIQGSLYQCLVYIITAPYEIATHQAVVCEYPNSYDATEEMKNENKLSADAAQEIYLQYGANKEAALRMADELYGYNMAVSVIDYGIEIDEWVFDPARKEGDSVRIDNTDGSYFIVYLNENPDDYDWVDVASGSMGSERYDTAFAEKVSKEFAVKDKYPQYVNDAWTHSYSILKPYIDERKSMYGLS